MKVTPSKLTPFMKKQMLQAARAFMAGVFLMYILISVAFTLIHAI